MTPSIPETHFPTSVISQQPEVASYERVDFREAVKLQSQADKTERAYNRGLGDFEELKGKLGRFGQKPSFSVEKLQKVHVSPDTTIREAFNDLKKYNIEAKDEVKKLARNNIDLGAQIEKEHRVEQYANELFRTSRKPKHHQQQPIHFAASYHAPLRFPRIQINPYLGALAGLLLGNIPGAILGGLACHCINQL